MDRLAGFLRTARRILVFTGAGISTASGIPDFRGPEGVWNTRRPVFYQDFMADQRARSTYWAQKLADRKEHGAATPNAVHEAIARLDAAGKVLLVVTQNVDGLHRASGLAPNHLVEIHGSNSEVECQRCGELTDPGPHFDRFEQTGQPPSCRCGGLLKPATISFGQSLRSADLDRSHEAAVGTDLVVALGTTLVVEPAASVPLLAARRGVPYVVVNRGETGHDGLPQVTLRIEGDVGVIVPPAVEAALAPDASRGDPVEE